MIIVAAARHPRPTGMARCSYANFKGTLLREDAASKSDKQREH